MLAIGTANKSLKVTSLTSLHPDSDAIGIAAQDFNRIAALIEEHKKAYVAHIALKVIFDNAVEVVEAVAHIDNRLAVTVDLDAIAEIEYGDYDFLFGDGIAGADRSERDAKRYAAWEQYLNVSRLHVGGLDSQEGDFVVALGVIVFPLIEGGCGRADGLAKLSNGELRSLKVSEMLFPDLGVC